MNTNQERFKTYLQKIGSGEDTSRGMTREESADALKLILTAQATPAQIGAFMIAHRIRRPEPQELAGMIGASRERVNKSLASFIKLGWLTQKGEKYVILDRKQLEIRAT